MFENSGSWATENHRILSTKEPTEAPLNVKKKGTKKWFYFDSYLSVKWESVPGRGCQVGNPFSWSDV